MAIRVVYRVLNLNPEPWAMGTISTIRGKGGRVFPKPVPNQQLEAFQNAVREELEGSAMLPFELVDLEFYFWRRLDRYRGPSGRWVNKQPADATNLQKGLEDALQKILFQNDRQVRKVTSHIVSQSHDTKPMIVVAAREYEDQGFPDFPTEVFNDIHKAWNDTVYEQPDLFSEVAF